MTEHPRNTEYEEETKQIFEIIQEERGDQRIGQFLINAVRSSRRFETVDNMSDNTWQEVVELVLWQTEAPELLEMLRDYSSDLNEG
jgi:hypothetical protein